MRLTLLLIIAFTCFSCQSQPVKKPVAKTKVVKVDSSYGSRVFPEKSVLLFNKWTGEYIIRQDSLHYFDGKDCKVGAFMTGFGESGTVGLNGKTTWYPCEAESLSYALKSKDSFYLKALFFKLYDKNVAESEGWLKEITEANKKYEKEIDFKPIKN